MNVLKEFGFDVPNLSAVSEKEAGDTDGNASHQDRSADRHIRSEF